MVSNMTLKGNKTLITETDLGNTFMIILIRNKYLLED